MKNLVPYTVAFFIVFSTIDLFANTVISRPIANMSAGQYVADQEIGMESDVLCIGDETE